jgi:predicted RNase H-like HicB family nuclease
MIIEKTDTGFSAYSVDYPIYTTGKSVADLISNAYEAVNLYYEDQKINITRDNLKFELDFRQFFQYYKVINSKLLADRIGMNATLLSQYVTGHKKPSETQTERILTGIHQIGQELAEIDLIYK